MNTKSVTLTGPATRRRPLLGPTWNKKRHISIHITGGGWIWKLCKSNLREFAQHFLNIHSSKHDARIRRRLNLQLLQIQASPKSGECFRLSRWKHVPRNRRRPASLNSVECFYLNGKNMQRRTCTAAKGSGLFGKAPAKKAGKPRQKAISNNWRSVCS